MKVAIVHDWFAVYGGAERVLEQIIKCFPQADLYTTVDFIPAAQRDFIQGRPIRTSFLQGIPFISKLYKLCLPLMPTAIERFDLRAYDLVISCSFAVAKGVLTHGDQLHVCYLQARNLKYAYEDRFLYQGNAVVRLLQDLQLSRIRVWDSAASKRPDITVANSQYVRHWHRKRHAIDCEVIYPPVDLRRFSFDPSIERDDYYVTTSRLEPYKRIDLIVDACTRLGLRLVVIGSGSEMDRLKKIGGDNVTFLGYQKADVIERMTARAKAFIFASCEDFGIAPLEAQACGTPVIALGKGGVLETIVGLDQPVPTGAFFSEQTVESLVGAITTFERRCGEISAAACREQALQFSNKIFRKRFGEFVDIKLSEFQSVSKACKLPLP